MENRAIARLLDETADLREIRFASPLNVVVNWRGAVKQ
jgi:hypothetical protein